MPKVYLPGTRKGNRRTIVRGHIDGRQYEIATDAGNARSALKDWDAFKSAVRQRAQSRRRAPETFREAVKAYKDARPVGKNDARYLDRLCGAWLESLGAEFGDLPIADVQPMHIGTAATVLYPSAKPQTVNRQVYTPAATVLHFAAENGLRDYIVVRKLAEPDPEPRRPARDVAQSLMDATKDRKRALLTLLFYQGWRITETLGLRAEKIDLPGRTFHLYARKSKKWVAVPMHEQSFLALANLKPALPAEGKVFTWGSRQNVYRWLRPLCADLGIAFTPHMARHEFAGALREAGATNRDLVDVGSWTSERSVARYTAAPTEHGRSILARLAGAKPGEGKRSA